VKQPIPAELVLTRDLVLYPAHGAVFSRESLVTCFGVPVFVEFLGKVHQGPNLPIDVEQASQWMQLQAWAKDHSTARR